MSGPANLVVRQMIPADGEPLSNMMASLTAYHGDTSQVNATDFLAHGLGESRLADVWLALADGAYAGFAATYDWMNFVQGHPVRHIDLLFVEDKFRKKGIGSTLIKEIAVNAKLNACERVTVGASKNNSAANEFYSRLGFTAREETSTRYQLSGAALNRIALSI